MDNGWETSARAWLNEMGEHGDFSRRYVLDPVMMERAAARAPATALDVGCGEGRFCRMLKAQGVATTGLEPTPSLFERARELDPDGRYVNSGAENLPFEACSFDMVVSYLSLIDIPDAAAAIREMVRVVRPGGVLLIANLNSFQTACGDVGWIRGDGGSRRHYPIDNYLEQRAMWITYRGMRIVNHHRPLSFYMKALLAEGLRLTHFDEPVPTKEAPPAKAKEFRRVPWFLVMEWEKPKAGEK
jgi:SAM-dependent methyltransferase